MPIDRLWFDPTETLIGGSWRVSASGARLPIDEVAHAAGTIGYELMCAVAPRLPMRSDG